MFAFQSVGAWERGYVSASVEMKPTLKIFSVYLGIGWGGGGRTSYTPNVKCIVGQTTH